MDCKGMTVCSLEAEVEINTYIKIADARAKVAEYDAIIESLADEIAQKFGAHLSHEDKYGM